jgi:predicted acetyltransferase
MKEGSWEIRRAKKGEVNPQKEIWKLCFGDSDAFIDFFFAKKYKEEETMLFIHEGEVAARLTMLPVRIVAPDRESFPAAMLYAVATHPKYQNRGFAGRLIEFTHRYLNERQATFSLLVPAENQLFYFYRKQGYEEAFYLRETLLTKEQIEKLPSLDANDTDLFKIKSIAPAEYNQKRNQLLQGQLYLAYRDEEISYQKELSQMSGADIFGFEIGKARGVAVLERLSSQRVLIKEILAPDALLLQVVKEMAKMLPVQEYLVRTPVFWGEELKGVRPFGMIRKPLGKSLMHIPGNSAYLGLAFD